MGPLVRSHLIFDGLMEEIRRSPPGDLPVTSWHGQEPPPVIAFHGCSWTNSQEIRGQISGGRYVKGDIG